MIVTAAIFAQEIARSAAGQNRSARRTAGNPASSGMRIAENTVHPGQLDRPKKPLTTIATQD